MIEDLWYKNAIVCCLSVETFMNAHGGGVGDFQGLTRRLGYLHGLGVTAIWLANVLTQDHSTAKRDGRHDICLETYGCRWHRLGGLDYLLKRTDF